MRIAVVIPAYNEAGDIGRLIDETVAAVPEASLQEVIVVDDASDDKPARRSRRCSAATSRCAISAVAGAQAKVQRSGAA